MKAVAYSEVALQSRRRRLDFQEKQPLQEDISSDKKSKSTLVLWIKVIFVFYLMTVFSSELRDLSSINKNCCCQAGFINVLKTFKIKKKSYQQQIMSARPKWRATIKI